MHVFADLRPYICTFSDCKDELAQFTTRATWVDHEFTEHRNEQTWNCPECSTKLASPSDWAQHLQEMHQRVFTGPQLHIARATASETYSRPVETEECPLCRIVLGKPRRAFAKHVGRHMEEIALMALPHNMEEDSDESSESSFTLENSSLGMEMAEVRAAEKGPEVPEEMNVFMGYSESKPPGRCYLCNRAKTSEWRRGQCTAQTMLMIHSQIQYP